MLLGAARPPGIQGYWKTCNQITIKSIIHL
jgi:hypothetical protein